jgi:uncharacterized protein (TIGR03437 family)
MNNNSRILLAFMGAALYSASGQTCGTTMVPAAVTAISAGDFATGGAQFIAIVNKAATVSLASDDAYSTDANGVITKAPSSGTGAFNYFSAQLPLGAPAVGSTKTPSDATATTTSVPFGALIGGWSAVGSATLPKTWFLLGTAGALTVPQGGGRLYLAVNDSTRADNTGAFSVTVASSVEVPANSTGVLAGPFPVKGDEILIGSTTGTVSLASDDAYSTDADGIITLAPTPGTGAYTFFSSQLPVGPPKVGGKKTPNADAVTPSKNLPFGALIGCWTNNKTTCSGGWFVVSRNGFLLVPEATPGMSPFLLLRVNDSNLSDNSGSFHVAFTDGGYGCKIGGAMISRVISLSDFGGFTSISPGSWIEIYGSGFASGPGYVWSGSDFSGDNAPTKLGGATVTVAGQPAFVYYADPGQIDVQVPSGVPFGVAQVVVKNSIGLTDSYSILVNPSQPGLLASSSFKIGGKQYAVAYNPDGSFALPAGSFTAAAARPAKPGETISLYGIGFGPVTPNIPAGVIARSKTQLALSFDVKFDTTSAKVDYAGLAPGYVGLYQINVVVPQVPDSDAVPLKFTLDGNTGSQTLYISVKR